MAKGSSARKALFWICVVQLVFAVLIGGLSAAYFDCGMNIQCFASFVCALLFVVPSSIYAYIGMQAANYKQATKASVVVYAVGCFVLAAVEAFIAVNMNLNNYGILQPSYQGFAALQAATGITAFVFSQLVTSNQ
eukprot:Phypoly_transcript_24733.p1 GENE.Phypoly_transcript_24733~~Phypoly_transcript_24733.p1  ORF type:complete len:135 (+),score=21.85 Phypoly_transcript_24733:102-506(+)